MFTDIMRDNLLETAQKVAGRKNRILNVGADVAGWAIRCAKGDEKIGEADLFYSGDPKEPYKNGVAEIYNSSTEAYNALLKDKVPPHENDNGEYEFPKIVYLQRVWITSDKEVE